MRPRRRRRPAQLAAAQRRVEAARIADVCAVHEGLARRAAAGLEDLRAARGRKLLLYEQRAALHDAAERVRHYRAKARPPPPAPRLLPLPLPGSPPPTTQNKK